MTDAVSDIARATAGRLGDEYGPSLAADVEVALQHEAGVPRTYADPISIAGLIVAIAGLAWSIYTELRRWRSTPTPLAENVAQAVRLRFGEDHALDDTAKAVIDVVAEETVKRGGN
jgi:hypothetical protein